MLLQLRAQAHLVHASPVPDTRPRSSSTRCVASRSTSSNWWLTYTMGIASRSRSASRYGSTSSRRCRVERGERLIEQQQPRLRQQRAAERHALPLTAGELARPPREQRLKTEQRDDLVEADGCGRRARALRAVTQVAADGQVRKQPRILEDVADAAPLGRHGDAGARVGQDRVVETHLARSGAAARR